jgi:PAS domain S-box-containing protein
MDIPFDFPTSCLGSYQQGTIWRASQAQACPPADAVHPTPDLAPRGFLSDERYAMLLQGLSDLGEGVILGEGSKIIYANQAFCELSGYSLDELLALPSASALAAPAHETASAERMRRLAGGQQIDRFEGALRHKSGRVVPLEIASKIIGTASRVQFISVMHDITSRKEAEARLQALNDELEQRVEERTAELATANDMFVALLNAMPDLMFRLHRDGTFLDFYAGEQHDLPLPPEQILGATIHAVFPAHLAKTLAGLIERALTADSTEIFEYSLAMPRGLREYEARIAGCHLDEVLVLVRDITKRKRVEDALRASEARNRAMLAAIPDTIVRLTYDGTILDFKHSHNMPDLPLDALRFGQPITDVLPVDDSLLDQFRAMQPGDPPLSAEYTIPQHFGDYLLARQLVSTVQLERARAAQRIARMNKQHLLLGEALVADGVMTPQ